MSSPRFRRRDVLRGTAFAAGYALAARPVAAEAVETPADGLEAGFVEIATPDGPMSAYRARPAEAEHPPAVLVVQEIFGLHAYIQDVCRRLAHEGYVAVAPDLYRRAGDPREVSDIQTLIREIVSQVRDENVLADLDAAVAWIEASGAGDADRLGITGFCWGGRIVWLYAAHSSRLDAGVAWYGRLEGAARPATPRHPLELAGSLRAPVLGLYGAEDRGIPVASVERMREALAEVDASAELVVYPDAGHGFHADYRASYHPESARDGWKRMLEWFAKHGAA